VLRRRAGRPAAAVVSLSDGTRPPCTATIVRLDPDPEWDLVTLELAAGAAARPDPVGPRGAAYPHPRPTRAPTGGLPAACPPPSPHHTTRSASRRRPASVRRGELVVVSIRAWLVAG
jgi:hypothetical protein